MNKKIRDSSWARIKNHINDNYEVGDILKRQTLIKNIKGVPTSTIDGYRTRLMFVGIIESSGRGKYRLLHKIPEQMNTIVLFDLIDDQRGQPWKVWFIPLEDRLKNYFNRYK